jgi:acyl-CoA hydrolase
MEPRTPSQSSGVLTHWMGITDANGAGNVHGGVVVKLADEAAALAAIRHCRHRVVTVGIDRLTFLVPIGIGELVTFKATVNAAWRSSMEVGVRVEAENPRTGEARHTTSAYITMVALDESGRPAAVPPLAPENELEQRRQREAELRRANRLAETSEIELSRTSVTSAE